MESTVVNSVISLFLIILIGVYAGKKNIITPEINKGLINILVDITLPLLMLSSFMTSFDNRIKGNVNQAFYYSIIAFIIIFFISYILVIPIKGDKKDVINFSNIFTNTGFLGFPLLNVIYGSEGVVYGSVFNIFFNLFVWSYGIMLFKGFNKNNNLKKEMINVLTNPSIIAVILGLIIMLFSIKVPEIIYSSLKLVGGITGPLSMIVIGAILSGIKFKNHLKDWTIYYGTIIKLIVIPFIIIYVFKLMGSSSIATDSIVIQIAMPTATLASIFAEKYNKELDYTTILLLMTTVFSIFTIPLIIKILG